MRPALPAMRLILRGLCGGGCLVPRGRGSQDNQGAGVGHCELTEVPQVGACEVWLEADLSPHPQVRSGGRWYFGWDKERAGLSLASGPGCGRTRIEGGLYTQRVQEELGPSWSLFPAQDTCPSLPLSPPHWPPAPGGVSGMAFLCARPQGKAEAFAPPFWGPFRALARAGSKEQGRGSAGPGGGGREGDCGWVGGQSPGQAGPDLLCDPGHRPSLSGLHFLLCELTALEGF